MSLAVTVDAERDQVVELIVAELASLGEVMHLQGRANRGCRRRDRMTQALLKPGAHTATKRLQAIKES